MRIVFASLGSLGDLHPLLAIARAAEKRGHVAVVAASEVYRDYVTCLGFEFFRIRPDFPHDPQLLAHLFHPQLGPERLMTEQVFPQVKTTFSDLMEATVDADFMVVGELLYVAPMVAEVRGIRWANAILAPTSFLSACDPCVLAPAPVLFHLRKFGPWPHRVIFWFGRLMTKRWSAPLQAFRKEMGFAAGLSPVFDDKHSPWLVLALFPRILAAPQRDWPPAMVQTGFPFFEQFASDEVSRQLSEFLAQGDPPVVVTLGSSVVYFSADFYAMAVTAIQQLGKRAILLAGPNAIRVPLPATMLRLDYAPLAAVLPHASAVVHQGGIGTCAESLRAGIPSVVVPFGYDQPDNGERLRRLGVAAVIDRKRVSAESLAAALRQVLETPGSVQRLAEIRKAMHPQQEMAATMDAIEHVARNCRKIIGNE